MVNNGSSSMMETFTPAATPVSTNNNGLKGSTSSMNGETNLVYYIPDSSKVSRSADVELTSVHSEGRD